MGNNDVKRIGSTFEKECCVILHNKGFWVHLFAYNQYGQPCDVIAVKNDLTILLDVKHCSADRFSFCNIAPNQLMVFEHLLSKGVKNIGFAIYFENIGWKRAYYTQIASKMYAEYKSIGYNELCDFEEFLNGFRSI